MSEYIYSSTELSRYFGITVKGMEFYEQKELVHPERCGAGNIRRYHLQDCYQLTMARMLRNCGFKVEETAQLLKNRAPEELLQSFEKRSEQIQDQILMQTGVLEGMQRIREGIQRVQKNDFRPKIVQHSGFRRLFIRAFRGEHEIPSGEGDLYRQWNRLMPVTEASLRFPRMNMDQSDGIIETDVGMIITEEDFHRFGLTEHSRVEKIPEGKAVYGIIRGSDLELDSREWLNPLLHVIQQQHLQITGDGFTRLIAVLENPKGTRIRYDEAWIPVS